MVSAPAVDDAVARAKALPSLNVGLHLVLSHGQACLPHAEIPDLADPDGRFSDNEISSGLRMFLQPSVRQQLKSEIKAQFEAFAKTGLRLDHVNAHRHMHLHPTVLDLIIRIGKKYGLTAVRLPAEPPLDALVEDRREMFRRRLRYLCCKPLIARMQRRLRANGLILNERVFGYYDSGHMDLDKMIRVLSHLPDGVSELYTHPATGPFDNVEPGAEDYEFEAEYKALIHPRVRRTVEKFAIELSGFNGADTSPPSSQSGSA